MIRRLILAIGLLLSGTNLLSAQSTDSIATTLNPHKQNRMPLEKFLRATNQKKRILNQYIVVLTDAAAGPRGKSSRAPQLTDLMVRMHGAHLIYRYSYALNGFAAKMTEEEAHRLSEEPEVAYVEEDQQIELQASWQTPAPWGLDRVDQRSLPLNNSYGYNYTGSGVRVYVIDSGIYTKGPFLTPDGRPHYEFGGRAVNVYDALGNNGGEDCYGHGTHVAGTIGSANYGVAKQALLRGVRVFDCKGNTAGASVDAGIEWVTRYHLKPAVANMSLGLPTSDIRAHSWDSMVTNMVAAGVTVVVAAGNYNQDACYYSPARAPGTITVGATDWNDSRASFASSTEPASNYGSCVDIFAPGKGIWSTGIQWNSGTGSMQGTYISMEGTSMATPHVAGAAALYLQHYPWASPSSVRNALVNTATSGKIWYAGPGSPNRLLYSFTY